MIMVTRDDTAPSGTPDVRAVMHAAVIMGTGTMLQPNAEDDPKSQMYNRYRWSHEAEQTQVKSEQYDFSQLKEGETLCERRQFPLW